MIRNLVAFIAAIPSLWLSIQVFGSIVSGDIDWTGVKLKREERPVPFWAAIIFLALVCCAVFGAVLAIFVGAI